jgi:DHA3 family macrolide efflux protein-like MFS transporter
MVMSTVVMGLGTLALGVVSGFWVYLFFMAIIGLVMPAFNTPFTVLLQQKVEADFLGRVFGVLGMISSIMMPMGMLVFGPVSDIIRIEYLLIGTGIMMVVVGLIMLLDKVLIEAGRST